MITEMTLQELYDTVVLNEYDLYDQFDEQKFLKMEYTKEEMIQIIGKWIIENDECEL